jgi:hypothetical protein
MDRLYDLLEEAAEQAKEAYDEYAGDTYDDDPEAKQEMLDTTANAVASAIFDCFRALDALKEAGATVIADPEDLDRLPQTFATLVATMPAVIQTAMANMEMLKERLGKEPQHGA